MIVSLLILWSKLLSDNCDCFGVEIQCSVHITAHTQYNSQDITRGVGLDITIITDPHVNLSSQNFT